MAINPLQPPQPPPPGLGPVPGVTSNPYTLMPGQGGMGPGAGAPPSGPDEAESADNVANIAKLMAMAGIDPNNSSAALAFLAGLGVPAAKRLSAQQQPRGATDDPEHGPGGEVVPGPGPGMPPGGPPQGMPPIGAR